MAVRKLRAKQRGPKCSFCSERANWRGVYFTRFACNSHYDLLVNDDEAQMRRDSYQTEAEWSIGL